MKVHPIDATPYISLNVMLNATITGPIFDQKGYCTHVGHIKNPLLFVKVYFTPEGEYPVTIKWELTFNDHIRIDSEGEIHTTYIENVIKLPNTGEVVIRSYYIEKDRIIGELIVKKLAEIFVADTEDPVEKLVKKAADKLEEKAS